MSTSAMGIENKRAEPHEAALPNVQKRLGPERVHHLPKVTQLKVEKLQFESRTEQLSGMYFSNYSLLLLLETEKEDEIQTLRRHARNTGGHRESPGCDREGSVRASSFEGGQEETDRRG